MSSILTNAAAMTALQTLTATVKALQQTQNHISTGLRISSAADNAAYWSISTTMKSDNAALSTVSDSLNYGASVLDVASNATTQAIDVASKIKQDLVSAAQSGVDRSMIQADISQLQKQLKSIAETATFNGQNWLAVDTAAAGYNSSKSIVSSYSHDPSGSVAVGTISLDGAGSVLFDDAGTGGLLDTVDTSTVGSYTDAGGTTTTSAAGGTGKSVFDLDISALTDSADDMALLNAFTKQVDAAIAAMTTSATNLGAVKSSISLQQSFITTLMDTIDQGISSLVDADMNRESTRLQALQVQQQLGVQALSIANQSSQSLMRLFG